MFPEVIEQLFQRLEIVGHLFIVKMVMVPFVLFFIEA
jgi:predicted nucleic-acid-binding protein